jgi:hypothetical protein
MGCAADAACIEHNPEATIAIVSTATPRAIVA